MNFDLEVFKFLNNFVNHSKILDYTGIFFAEYSQYILGVILLIALFYPKNRRDVNRPMVIMSLVAAVIARYGVKTLILLFYHRPRPYIVLATAHKLLPSYTYENYQAFPSGHAIFFFALAAALFCFNKKVGIWFFVAAVIMGISRVFTGVHWPTDILGGAILGTGVGFGTHVVYNVIKIKADKLITEIFSKAKEIILNF